MKKIKIVEFFIIFGFLVQFICGCGNEQSSMKKQNNGNIEDSYDAVSFFWGSWVRMDNGQKYDVLEKTVMYAGTSYDILYSDENNLEVKNLGVFKKQSESVIICDSIPYFRKGGTNIEYKLKIVGFANQDRAASTFIGGAKGTGKSEKYKNFESNGESDADGIIRLKAPTINDVQTATITNGEEIVVVTGLEVTNNGEDMGTVAFAGKDDYSLKITGTISDDQKDNGYMYGNNKKTYDMTLTITNISKNKCPYSICTIAPEDSRLVLSSSSNLAAFPISTMASGATKKIKLQVSFGAMTEPYVETGIVITIRNTNAGKEWNDYVPLRFYKGTMPITVMAKNPEKNENASLNGFVIYPDGNNQFFSVRNDESKVIYVPTFNSGEQYKLVFSGATVTSNLSDSTEMYYSVAPGTKQGKIIDLRLTGSDAMDILAGYRYYGGDNHSEETAFSVEKDFIAYLSEDEIDWYTITLGRY